MKKFGTSLLVLLVLGIFAGLAIAQSGAVTSVLRVNTNENALELSNNFRASAVRVASNEFNSSGLFIADGGKVCIGAVCIPPWPGGGGGGGGGGGRFWKSTDYGLAYYEESNVVAIVAHYFEDYDGTAYDIIHDFASITPESVELRKFSSTLWTQNVLRNLPSRFDEWVSYDAHVTPVELNTEGLYVADADAVRCATGSGTCQPLWLKYIHVANDGLYIYKMNSARTNYNLHAALDSRGLRVGESAELNTNGLFIADGGKICIGDNCVLDLAGATYWKGTDVGIEYSDGNVDVFSSGSNDLVRISPTNVIIGKRGSGYAVTDTYAELNKGGLHINNGTDFAVVAPGSIQVGTNVGGVPISSVRIESTSIFVPEPGTPWECVGDICYVMGSMGEVTLPTAMQSCTSIGAHLCSVAEYGHFIYLDSVQDGRFWTSDAGGGFFHKGFPHKTDYKQIWKSRGKWGVDDWDISSEQEYYCCKYIGAVYNTS